MKRIESLDALRGIAALIVVAHHCAMTVPGLREWFQASILLRPVVAGPSAVMIFFVLSGFVLYLALDRHDQFRYLPYIAKRTMRIYPPLVVAILLSACLYVVVRPQPIDHLSGWYNTLSWGEAPSIGILAGHLLLFDGTDFQSFNNVIWSLVHEMRILFVFPLIALGIRRHMKTTLTMTLLLSIVGMHMAGPSAPRTMIDPFATMQYLFQFSVGAALARHGDAIRAWVNGPRGQLIGPALLASGIVLGLMVGKTSAIGSICLVTACFAYRPLAGALARQPFIWLGKVSYSLYLTHLLVLLTLVHVLHDILPIGVVLAGVFPVSLLVAAICHRYVEMPTMRFGRWLAALGTPHRGRTTAGKTVAF